MMSSFGPHLAAGLVVGAISTSVCYTYANQLIDSYLYLGLPLLAGVTGALTPDMDIKSKSSQCMYILYAGLALYLYYINRVDLAFFTLLYSIIPQFFGHRKFIHSFIFCLISSIGLYFIGSYITDNIIFNLIFASTYMMGFISHILLDKATTN